MKHVEHKRVIGAMAWLLVMLPLGCGRLLYAVDATVDAEPRDTTTADTMVPDTMMPPTMTPLTNVSVTIRGDTAIVEFEPVLGARDYRIYVAPDPADVMDVDGAYAVRNALYRCAGDRPLRPRERDAVMRFDLSLENDTFGYHRTAVENVLGHVYLVPGANRRPVYRIADPNANGGYDWEYSPPPTEDYNGAEYVVDPALRATLLARGWRDDGIAFYTSDAADSPIYRREYVGHVSIFYGDGAEHDAHEADDPGAVVDAGERFRVLAQSAEGTVPLYRVHYRWAASHDVLAAGEERYERVLHQGNRPMTSLSWPGLTGSTELVIEALDAGCPFSGGHIGVEHRDAADHPNSYPTWTLDESRHPGTGEVFINGQHDPANRPQPIARSTVTAAPAARSGLDWHEDFDVGGVWDRPVFVGSDPGINASIYRSASFSVEFTGCFAEPAFGPLLGRFDVDAEGCGMQLIPRGVAASLQADRFLHARMSVDIPSTRQRFPVIWITTATLGEDVLSFPRVADALLSSRLGPIPEDGMPPTGEQSTIVVQPVGGLELELQVQFCDLRGYGGVRRCPRANVYGPLTGVPSDTAPWNPMPVLGELASSDRLVQFDVYASTERVFVTIDGVPAGCVVLPAGRMPAGPVTIAFSAIGEGVEADQFVVPAEAPHEYWARYGVTHLERQFDDLAIELSSAAPPWDEAIVPCGSRWTSEP